MRLIDADKLNRKDVNCANVPMNFIDTAPTVEAIPKADMLAMLDKIRDEILEYIDDLDIADAICEVFDKYEVETEAADGNNTGND